eukprot:m.206661 g.206661  ORF g.206661 m.206661 type:complete len:332 (-) comp26065_c0_seq1:200-1195(-)
MHRTMPHVCQECHEEFKCRSLLKRHTQRKHSRETFPCPNCHKAFRSSDHLKRHQRTQHDDKYKHNCPVCSKGFEDKKKLQQHHRSHDLTSIGPKVSARFLHDELTALQAKLIERSKYPQPRCTAVACTVAARDRQNEQLVFQCCRCQQFRHWACAGYDQQDLAILPAVICPSCGPVTASTTASTNRRLLEAYATKMGWTIQNQALDGWCLLKSVAAAVQQNFSDLFTHALQLVPDLKLPETERAAILADCQKHLARDHRRHLSGNKWNSPLFDHLPRALALAVDRPIHVLEAVSGEIKLHVHPAKDSTSVPIRLLRSFTELGWDHYDLIAE